MAAGSNSQLATVRMTSYGVTSVYVTAASFSNWRWTNFVSEGLEHKIEELVEQSIYGYADEPPSHQGLTTAEGDIEFEPNPMAFGQFMRGYFGIGSRSVLCDPGSVGANATVFSADGVYRYEFVPRQAAFADECYLDPYQVLIYRDVGSAFVFQDTVFNKLEVGIQAGQLVRATVGVMGRRVTRVARAAVSSLVSSGGRPFVWDMASVQVGIGPGMSSLAASNVFENLNIQLEVPIEGVPLLDGTRFYGEMQKSDFRKTRFTGTITFRNQNEYDAFVAYENRGLRVSFQNVNSAMLLGNPASAHYFQMQYDIPQFKITQYGVMVRNAQRITADFEGRGEYDTALGYAVKGFLTTVVASY